MRCGHRILAWANHVIAADPQRPADRALVTPTADSPQGEVALLRFRQNVAESKGHRGSCRRAR